MMDCLGQWWHVYRHRYAPQSVRSSFHHLLEEENIFHIDLPWIIKNIYIYFSTHSKSNDFLIFILSLSLDKILFVFQFIFIFLHRVLRISIKLAYQRGHRWTLDKSLIIFRSECENSASIFQDNVYFYSPSGHRYILKYLRNHAARVSQRAVELSWKSVQLREYSKITRPLSPLLISFPTVALYIHFSNSTCPLIG